jgi:NitT/TauT family transport system substrate-binding protein
MFFSHLKLRSLLPLLLILSIWITACSPTVVTPTQAPIEKISLQLQWVTQAQFAGYYVALDKGWYTEEGIDLKIIPGAPDVVALDLVVSGTREFGTALLADLTLAAQSNKPVISLAQIQQKNGLMLVARKDSGIASPQDFKGKRVGVWLGSWEAQFWALMSQSGLTKTDFKLVSQGYSMEPFIKKELDVASAMIYNEYQGVLESGIPAADLNVIDYADYGLGFPGDTLFTSLQMVKENPNLCARMVKASLRGWQYAINHPEEAVDIVLKYDDTGMQTRPHQLAMMKEISKLVQVDNQPLGQTDEAAVQRTIDNLFKYGVLSSSVIAKDVFTNQFWVAVPTE